MAEYAASGIGDKSKFYDENILFDGSYQIISVTLDKSSRDATNPEDTEILRPGLLLAPTDGFSGMYTPISTADGYLNGTPTQHMVDVVVLGRKMFMTKAFIMGNKRQRTVLERDLIAPAYLACNIIETYIYYNNSGSLAITNAQFDECQRIYRTPAWATKYDKTENPVRALLWNRLETIVPPSDQI